MPNCRKCDNYFPNRINIDDKYRNLQHRKYCIDCSPFRRNNRKKLHLRVPGIQKSPDECVCSVCGKIYLYDKKKSHTKSKCGSCSVNQRRFSKKSKLIELKGGRCQLCGYNRYQGSLVFHHLDETKKKFQISGNHARSMETLLEELDKCLLLCNNCHAEVHAGVAEIITACSLKKAGRFITFLSARLARDLGAVPSRPTDQKGGNNGTRR